MQGLCEGNMVGYANEAKQARLIDHNPTVGENIDRQIAIHQEQIARLEASKKTLSPLLDMKIGDLRQAMSF